MGIILWFLLIIWNYLVAICMADCAIQPDGNGNVTIPGNWSGLVNGSIPSSAFQSCSALQSVTIPDSVTSIGSSAFYQCSELQSVTIGDSVMSIGDNAFDRCSALQSMTIGGSVTVLVKNVFIAVHCSP